MPPTQVSELRSMLQVFTDIIDKRPGALSPRIALAKLQSALARGHLFSGFSQGPPEWTPGLKPLRLDRSATELACHELNHYGLLCAEVGAVEKYSPTSSLWNSLYAVQPAILRWMEFFHPMNKNTRLKDDALYSHGVGVTLISLFGGLIYPRHVMETQRLASWIIEHRLDVYIIDLWVNLPRYVVDPAGGTAARAMEWMYTLFRCLRGARMPARVDELLITCTGENPRRLCRSIAYYAEVIPVKEYAILSDNLWELACHLISEAPELVPSTVSDNVIRRLVSALKYAVASKAWSIALGLGFYLQNLWLRTSSLRALELSIRAGVFEILVDLCRKLPASERALHQSLSMILLSIYRNFVFWRPLKAFHDVNRRMVDEEGTALSRLRPMLATLVACYKDRYFLLLLTRQERRKARQHCQVCCPNKSGEGRCCREPSTTRVMRCSGCFDAFYCSAACQRAHWHQGHNMECRPFPGRGSGRDKRYIGFICTAYIDVHAADIGGKIRELDSTRSHHVYIDVVLTGARVEHRVVIGSACNTGQPHATIIGEWEDGMNKTREVIGYTAVEQLEKSE